MEETKENLDKLYMEGYSAASKGEYENDCPYNSDSVESSCWKDGWNAFFAWIESLAASYYEGET